MVKPPQRVCSFLFILVFSQTCTSLCLSTISRWVSFGHSTLLLHNSTQTHGPLSKPFGSYVTCSVSIQLCPPFSIIILSTRPILLATCLLLVGRVTRSSPSSHPHKNFKGKVFKIFIELEGRELVLDQDPRLLQAMASSGL